MEKRKLEVVRDTGTPPLQSGDDGGTFGPLVARVAKLEADMGHVLNTLTEIKADVRDMKRDSRSDFRTLFGAIIAVALGLAGLMARGFGWL